MKKIIEVKPLEDYRLELTFDDNTVRIKDMKPYLNKGVFKELKDKNKFKNIKIDYGTVSWNNNIDLCADYLYETSEEIKR